MLLFQATLGLVAFPLIAWLLSRDRSAVRVRVVCAGIGLQVMLALIVKWAPGAAEAFVWFSQGVEALAAASGEGARFVFGYLAGGPLPFEEQPTGSSFIVAFRVLPLVLVVSAISAVLHHVGVIPFVTRMLAQGVQRVFSTSGPLAFGAAASIFFGIIEGPLLVRPYLRDMEESDLFALMTCGMATVAGTVMVLYAGVVEPVAPGALGQILLASLLSVPAALMMSHVMHPSPATLSRIPEPDRPDASVMEALMRGTQEGTRAVIDIAATIIVLFALVHLCNQMLALVPVDGGWSLQAMVGAGFRPLMWMTGMPWTEACIAADLMGTKTVLNEFVAYVELSSSGAAGLSARSREIVVAAMCGFANLGSMGILVGGLGSVIPERRSALVSLAARALIAGTLATLETAAVIGIFHAT